MINRYPLCLFVLYLLTGSSCKNPDALFTALESTDTHIDFSNEIQENEEHNILNFMNIYAGAGVGVGDINNDGLTDIFFAGNIVPDRLYVNKGGFNFEDITARSGINNKGWSTGVSMVDINQDGWLDIYVAVSGGAESPEKANKLYINQKNNTFTEEGESYGLADTSQSTHAAFFDYDRDGDLDMFLIINPVDYTMSSVNTIRARKLNGESNSTDKLYRNNGDSTFTDVSAESGILIEGYSLGLGISDIDNDGWPDVYVSNDFLTNDILYRNNGDGTFSDVSNTYFKHTSFAGMGNDIADYNNDGLADILVLDMLPEDHKRQKTIIPASNFDKFQMTLNKGYTAQYTRNTLQLNNGNNSFSEIGQFAGISQTDWSWSVLLADYDNDGLKDAFITNGFRRDIGDMDYINYQQESSNPFGSEKARRERKLQTIKELPSASVKNYFYKNNGDFTFTNTTTDWGIEHANLSNGSAFADFDNDGDLDLVVNNINEKASILQNNSEKNQSRYLKLKLIGKKGNRDGIGTKITVHTNGDNQYYQHFLSRGYESSVDQIVHFGLGKTKIDSITIVWPDQNTQVLKDVKENQMLTVEYAKGIIGANHVEAHLTNTLLKEITDSLKIDFEHKENSFVDFKVQLLLPHMHSKNGPKMTKGDINGDGLQDFYIGGSKGYSGVFFVQGPEGGFKEQPLNLDIQSEDMGSLLFDADNDGDNDLYVVSGGSEFKKQNPWYQDRLYLNDGHGNFTKDESALPKIEASGSIVRPFDFDGDNDLDLFVGGRLVPGEYPTVPRSFVLRNQNGKFQDITQELNPELSNIGMVTDAIWEDYDQDGETDLIVVGEFMNITVFKNTDGKLENVTKSTGLSDTSGWWNCIKSADIDGDGDMDFFAGNLGTNSRYKASISEPLCIYAKDYDKNNSIDPIMCYYIQGKNYIAHPRDLLVGQIASMRGRFATFGSYAEVEFEDAFLPEELENALIVKAMEFQSLYLENLGDGTFKTRALPPMAQIAPINDMAFIDADKDGQLDVLIVGNNYSGDSAIGNHDAMIGLLLKGDGKGGFSSVPVTKSGFYVHSDAKDIQQLKMGDGREVILVGSNSSALRAFSYVH